MVEKDIMK